MAMNKQRRTSNINNVVAYDANSQIQLTGYTQNGILRTTSSNGTVIVDTDSVGDGIVSGGVVTWSGTGLTYNISPCTYIINGQQYKSPSTSVTLTASNATYDRIDVFAVNTSNQAVVITGTPSANPQEPQTDPALQIQLTNVTVTAASTTPSGITTNMIYDENVESWTKASSATLTSDFANTTNPFSGTYCISSTITSTANPILLSFYKISTYTNKSEFNTLSFAIKLNQPLLSSESIKILFQNLSLYPNTIVAQYSITQNNSLGFSITNTSSYQVISIPLSSITFSNNAFNWVQIQIVTSRNGLSFRFDKIFLQGGISQPSGKEYLPLSGGTMTGQIVLSKSTSPTDYSNGLKFPNDPFGGSNDTAGIRLYEGNYGSTEDQVLELYVTNDNGGTGFDIINFAAPSNNSVRINNNIIWNQANDGSGSGLDADLLDGYDSSYFLFGSGTTNYVTKWATSKSLTNSLIYDNGTSLGIGTTSPLAVNKLQVVGRIASDVTESSVSNSVYSVVGTSYVTYAGGSSLSGSVVLCGAQGGIDYTFGGNVSIPNSVPTGAVIAVAGYKFTSTGTVTQDQGGSGTRAIANIFSIPIFNGSFSGTITHSANIRCSAFYTMGGATLTVNNYYGLIMEQSDYFGINIVNKWGIYQEGSGDNNYFAGKVLIGGNIVGSSKLKITGLPTSSAGLSAGDVWNDAGTLKIV